MPSLHRGPLALALAALVVSALVVGCSKSGGTAPSNPPVSGPTFDFTFTSAAESHQFTFTDVGTWGYRCIVHGSLGMTGTVIVDPASTDSSLSVTVGSPPNMFSPASVTIKPGGKVTWVLAAGAPLNHTVTRP